MIAHTQEKLFSVNISRYGGKTGLYKHDNDSISSGIAETTIGVLTDREMFEAAIDWAEKEIQAIKV